VGRAGVCLVGAIRWCLSPNGRDRVGGLRHVVRSRRHGHGWIGARHAHRSSIKTGSLHAAPLSQPTNGAHDRLVMRLRLASDCGRLRAAVGGELVCEADVLVDSAVSQQPPIPGSPRAGVRCRQWHLEGNHAWLFQTVLWRDDLDLSLPIHRPLDGADQGVVASDDVLMVAGAVSKIGHAFNKMASGVSVSPTMIPVFADVRDSRCRSKQSWPEVNVLRAIIRPKLVDRGWWSCPGKP